jgi:hypothetical protein
MPIKRVAHKELMAKKKSGNAVTSWVPSEFEESDLTKAQRDGFLAGGEQVIFPSTERIPKRPSGYRVMFLAFLLRGLSLPAHEWASLCLRRAAPPAHAKFYLAHCLFYHSL